MMTEIEEIQKTLQLFNCGIIEYLQSTERLVIEGKTNDIDELLKCLDKRKIANRRAIERDTTQLELDLPGPSSMKEALTGGLPLVIKNKYKEDAANIESCRD